MERTYNYKFGTKQYGDEYDYDEYEYTACGDELKDAIVEELWYTYFNDNERKSFSISQIVAIKKALKNLTDDNDNWEDLADDFESELKEYFEYVAYEEYTNREEI